MIHLGMHRARAIWGAHITHPENLVQLVCALFIL